MKSEDIDWKLIRGAIIIFVITLIISGGLVYGSFYFESQMQLEFNRTNSAFRSISNRYLAVDQEERLIREYLPQFVDLYTDGIIGDEQRLNWIEVLREIGDEIRLPSLSYRIESQQEYTPEFELDKGNYKLFSSSMILTMQLLHEGDLFKILDRLEQSANGTFSLKSCSISSSASEVSIDPNAANVSAECELQWYTVKLANGDPIEFKI
ncbi:MAG: hypothetical protein HKN08_12795 [Gammaproteobacteria bacterium]|nr:hypothetical protein [Gammaproteobacteria bacterium]